MNKCVLFFNIEKSSWALLFTQSFKKHTHLVFDGNEDYKCPKF